MNASLIFFTVAAIGALITYPDVVLKLLAVWFVIVVAKLVC